MTFLFFRYFLCVLPSSPKTLTIFLCMENNLLGSVQTTMIKVNFIFKSPMKKELLSFPESFHFSCEVSDFYTLFGLNLTRWNHKQNKTDWVSFYEWFLKRKMESLKFDLQGSGNTKASVRSEVSEQPMETLERLILQKVD